MWKLRLPVAWNSSGIMHAAGLPPSGEGECRLLMETWLWSPKTHLVHVVWTFFFFFLLLLLLLKSADGLELLLNKKKKKLYKKYY